MKSIAYSVLDSFCIDFTSVNLHQQIYTEGITRIETTSSSNSSSAQNYNATNFATEETTALAITYLYRMHCFERVGNKKHSPEMH